MKIKILQTIEFSQHIKLLYGSLKSTKKLTFFFNSYACGFYSNRFLFSNPILFCSFFIRSAIGNYNPAIDFLWHNFGGGGRRKFSGHLDSDNQSSNAKRNQLFHRESRISRYRYWSFRHTLPGKFIFICNTRHKKEKAYLNWQRLPGIYCFKRSRWQPYWNYVFAVWSLNSQPMPFTN